jgi:hypothetical protein
MSPDLTIRTNGHRRELVSFEEAGSPDDFDYIAGEDRYSPRLFSYRGAWYDLNEFDPVGRSGAPNHMANQLPGWDAFQSDSFFSGIAVRILSGDDEGFIVAALVMA